MKLSYSWLKQLVPNLKLSPEKLGEILSKRTAEVEEIIRLNKGLERVVVAEILSIRPHPQADRLQIVLVNIGKEKREVVCGAPNIRLGQKVPLALEGACLPNGIEIKKAFIRGVESGGMLCAEDELGLGTDHSGILILPFSMKVGDNLAKAMGLDEIILEIENKSLTHRPDLFNHYGFAREIRAILGLKCKFENLSFKIAVHKQPARFQRISANNTGMNKIPIKIRILEKKLCPRYLGVIIEGAKIKDSPMWLQNRLRNLGIKPINNVVDITNYILVEIGQPLHAFDADKIEGNEIIVRRARSGEKILALDKKEYELKSDDLVITDERKPIALAGIIGGEESSITESTRRIFIESANFDSVTVRRTSWRLGLRTEAVLRFEKGLPMIFPEWGLSRAIKLIQELTQGEVAGKIYDLTSSEAKKIIKAKREINFDFNKIKRFIGQEIKSEIVKKILKGLDCKIKSRRNSLIVIPPSYRPDLNFFEDLVEEVTRIYGLEKIIPQPIISELRPIKQSQEIILERQIKNFLIGLGFDEVYNYAFYGSQYVDKKEEHIEIENPLNKDQVYLRTSLIPLLLEKGEKNFNLRNWPLLQRSDLKIFEIGKVFRKNKNKIQENKYLAGVVLFLEEKKGKFLNFQERSIFKIKGIVDFIFKGLGLKPEYEKDGRLFLIKFNKEVLGKFGLIDRTRRPDVKNLNFFEINLEKIFKQKLTPKEYKPIFICPPMIRDLAFVIKKKDFYVDKFLEKILQLDQRIVQIKFLELTDLGDGRYNLCFSITYQCAEKTLETKEVELIEKKIINFVQQELDAKLRNF